MKEKKQVKISLGTAICVFIIIILVASMVGTVIYYNNEIKNKNIKKEVSETNENKIVKEKNDEYNNDEEKKDEDISDKLELNESYVGTWKINYVKRKRR